MHAIWGRRSGRRNWCFRIRTPSSSIPPGRYTQPWFLLLLITAIVLCARDKRYLAVGWFWFLGSLVPMIGLVQVGEQAMADRYAYIPFLGLF